MGTFCGSSNKSAIIKSLTNRVTLVLDTKGRTWTYAQGFSLNFTSNDDIRIGSHDCGEELNMPSGTFTSPGYPTSRRYHNICRWQITVPEGRRVRVDIQDYQGNAMNNSKNIMMVSSKIRRGCLVNPLPKLRYAAGTEKSNISNTET